MDPVAWPRILILLVIYIYIYICYELIPIQNPILPLYLSKVIHSIPFPTQTDPNSRQIFVCSPLFFWFIPWVNRPMVTTKKKTPETQNDAERSNPIPNPKSWWNWPTSILFGDPITIMCGREILNERRNYNRLHMIVIGNMDTLSSPLEYPMPVTSWIISSMNTIVIAPIQQPKWIHQVVYVHQFGYHRSTTNSNFPQHNQRVIVNQLSPLISIN